MNNCDICLSRNIRQTILVECRLLPTGGDSNMIVCRYHYRKELRYRLYRTLNDGTEWQFPAWHTLKIYDDHILYRPLNKEENI
jgi:hypothetical protein